MTVSRVLKNQKRVSAETREHVLKIVEELRYTPNQSARSLAAGNPTQIGFIYANTGVAYLKNFLAGAVERARETGHQLVIETCDIEDEAGQRETARRMANADIGGAILPPPLSESEVMLTELARWRIRFATVAVRNPSENPLRVSVDHCQAAADMTSYLLSLGHSRIGFIRGHLGYGSAVERERGFCATLEAAGIDPKSCPVEQGNYTFESGVEAAQLLLDRNPDVTAIFASNDDMAAGVINVAHRRGLQVPRDLTVVGFDDMEIAQIVWPRLTTIRQPVSQMAAAAIDLLLADLAKRDEPSAPADLVLEHELVVRESSGPPPLDLKPARAARS